MNQLSSPEVLRLRGLTHVVREGGSTKTVLHDVDLVVGAAEKLAVVGRSGAGKSTLLNVMGLLTRPTAGELWFRGTRWDGLRRGPADAARAGDIGFVFQAMNLVPHLTVAQNVRLGAPRRQVEKAAVDAALEDVGLDAAQFAGRRAARLSLGEQQRVAVARALVKRAPLVLADEPTGSLDAQSEASVLAALDAAVAAGSSVVAVTHSDRVAAWADRVVAIENSTLVEQGVRS